MLLDKENQYSEDQAVTAAAASTNVIDHIVPKTGLGAGEVMTVLVAIKEVTTAANFSVILETSADEAFTAPVILTQRDILAAEVVEGARIYFNMPSDYRGLQYTRVRYVGSPSVVVNTYLIPQSFIDAYETFQNNSTITG